MLVDKMGVQRVMLGSDAPFPLGEQRIGALVRDTLDAAAQQRVLADNARAFFAI
jgi:aminocarboxymuconate-semialdehyde decarboxylase